MAIPIDAVDWHFLTKIATAYTKVRRGRACLVYPAPGDAHYWGQAALRDDGYLHVSLRLDQPLAELGRTFWHEVAHAVLHTQTVAPDKRGLDLANIDTAEIPGEYAELVRVSVKLDILQREREADEWGEREAAQFVQRYGLPIERMAVRGDGTG